METKSSLNKSGIATETVLKQSKTQEMAEGEFHPADMLAVSGLDDRYVYRWLNATKLQNSGGFDPRGFEVVKTLDGQEAPKFKAPFNVEVSVMDGTIRRGDAVLARMPKDMAEKRRLFFKNKLRQREEIITVKNKTSGTKTKVEFESRRGNQVERYE